jgi:hypothetical protein
MEVRNRQLEGLADRIGLPFIDLTRAFDREDRPLELFDPVDAHLSPAGAALAAEAILRDRVVRAHLVGTAGPPHASGHGQSPAETVRGSTADSSR